ncbi:LysR family transcriptional regulator [Embleya scabrispora]|uniref:LysR family transcriptional regulator n=1 Tax=Embleya scabrispora TaxID=159449 RepID=A0A1T3NRJ1_9ACTN|nr:LysR family substrate-binding domain-containing protein [Embleya scabrispora]OPC79517.1 LysR family transcriptional regulator [Embleya scabrispora]
MTGAETPSSFRLAYVPGVTPAKWVRIWNERLPDVSLTLLAVTAADAGEALRGGGADAGLVRLPMDRTGLNTIPMYTETTVVVIPKDHDVTAVDEVSVDDLADFVLLHPLDDPLDWTGGPPGVPAKERPATTADAIELVAAGVGLLIVPQSLARLHHRKDLTYRPLTGAGETTDDAADVPQSRVALAWPEGEPSELMEEFIGIIRGRTVNSSRGRTPTPPQPKSAKAAAKRPDTRHKPSGTGATGRGSRGGPGSGKSGKRGKPRGR